MIDDILFDSRHKFVYFEESKRDEFRKECLDFVVDINKSIPVYINDNGLPKIESSFELDKYRVVIFHDRYYDFLIALSVIDALIGNFGKEFLNKKLKRTFEIYSYSSKMSINDIDDLRYVLEYDKNLYFDGYKKYLATGSIDFYDKLIIGFISLDILLKNIKRNIGLKGYFSTLFDYSDLTVNSMQIINKYINSRCNGYLSINVLCGDNNWDTYYDCMGCLIQNIHDYTEIDYRDIKKKVRHI